MKFDQRSTHIGLFGLSIIALAILMRIFGKDELENLIALYITISSAYRAFTDDNKFKRD